VLLSLSEKNLVGSNCREKVDLLRNDVVLMRKYFPLHELYLQIIDFVRCHEARPNLDTKASKLKRFYWQLLTQKRPVQQMNLTIYQDIKPVNV